MKTTTKNEIKDCLFMFATHLVMILVFILMLSVNAKADTIKKNSLNTCKTISIQPMQNGVIVADMIDNYSIADYEKVILDLTNKEFTTHNNNGYCTVRYSINKTTEQKLKDNEPIIIGVRNASIPVSYEYPKGSKKYMGLSVDICLSAIEKIKTLYPNLKYEVKEVNSSNRIALLNEGLIDMECGSTTANDNRLNGNNENMGVSFSIPVYWANVIAVTTKDSKLNSIYDLKDGDKLIYTKGTTTEKAIEKYSIVFKAMNQNGVFTKIIGNDHDDSFNKLTEIGGLFANDDILITSLIAKSKDKTMYKLLKDKLSIEPYAIMTRKNDKWLTIQVDKSINEDMRNGIFDKIYDKWFMQSIPPFNKSLDLPQSLRLRETVRFPNNVLGG